MFGQHSAVKNEQILCTQVKPLRTERCFEGLQAPEVEKPQRRRYTDAELFQLLEIGSATSGPDFSEAQQVTIPYNSPWSFALTPCLCVSHLKVPLGQLCASLWLAALSASLDASSRSMHKSRAAHAPCNPTKDQRTSCLYLAAGCRRMVDPGVPPLARGA